ncbi:hypothetical protein M0R72_20710 [Candidatus Pacearchaeota archaeon]|jgi:hypothetical protein|nr:hypothetical protein [Candidatus Pacearchaeota archaeon]
MDANDAIPVAIINGRALQIMWWSGPDIPGGWVPLDGRTIDGVTLPDRRTRFLSGTGENVAECPKQVFYQLIEIVRLHDLVVDGELKIAGIFPAVSGV